MVDTIKFRAWHKEEKVYYNNVHLLGNAILYSFENDNNFDHIADLDDVILEQYTGLKDKNDTEIYEGDIVEVGEYTIEEVKFYAREQSYYKRGDKLVIVSIAPIFDIRDYEDYKAHTKHQSNFSPNGYMVRPRASNYDLWNYQHFTTVVGSIHEGEER